MKKLLALCALVSFLVPVSVFAADFKGGPDYTLGKSETASGDLYVAAQTITSEGTVPGDFNAIGGNVIVLGTVTQTAQVAGGTLTLMGTVGSNVRAAGGTITLGSNVKGDVLLGGGQVMVLPSAIVGGDLVIAGKRVTMAASVVGEGKNHLFSSTPLPPDRPTALVSASDEDILTPATLSWR